MIRPPPISPLFPSPALFRSSGLPVRLDGAVELAPVEVVPADQRLDLAVRRIDREESPFDQRLLVEPQPELLLRLVERREDRKSTRLNSSHDQISYAVFCLKK